MAFRASRLILPFVPFLLAVGLAAQEPAPAAPDIPRDPRIGGLFDDLTRIHEILGLAPYHGRVVRRLSRPDSGAADLRITLLPVRAHGVANSGFPRTGNDGLLWAGRGASMAVSAGARLRWGPLSAALAPEIAWQQNAPYEFARVTADSGFSEFVLPFHRGIDLPQRFGDAAYVSVAPGQSHVRLDAWGAALGFSSENLWWGPAARYPILMGSTAPGFPHAFVGTSGPLGVGIGALEVELVWGRLTESDYFDVNPDNDHSMLVGLVGAFSPYLFPGLTLGGIRVFQYAAEPGGSGWDFGADALLGMFGGTPDNRPGNELASLFARWVFVESGAEVYFEWGRDDRFMDLEELIQEPDHGQVYLLGAQKVTPVHDDLSLRVQIEAVALQEQGPQREGSRFIPVVYTHSSVRQGYTHRGQLLGAWIGPGGDAQYLALDALLPWGTFGGFIERVRRVDASNAALEARRWSPYEHDTEMTFALRSLVASLGDVRLAGTLSFGYRFNRDFLGDDSNIGLAVEGAWTPGWRDR